MVQVCFWKLRGFSVQGLGWGSVVTHRYSSLLVVTHRYSSFLMVQSPRSRKEQEDAWGEGKEDGRVRAAARAPQGQKSSPLARSSSGAAGDRTGARGHSFGKEATKH